jgi:uncharacterized RDD family membrane protein YckC
MTVDQENVSRILSVLSHQLRRNILLYLNDKQECTFSDLASFLNADSGKLSFHLRNLGAFLEQTETGKYRLSRVGQNAVVLIKDLETWAYEADVAKKTSSLPLADHRKRIFAFLIDLTVCFTLFLAIPSMSSSLISWTLSILNFDILLFLFIFWIYFTLLEGFAGQSLGKRVLGLRVVRIDGKNLTYDSSAVRNFGKVFLFPLDLYFGYRLKDPRFLRYFDKFSFTTVVDLHVQSERTENSYREDET